MPYEAVHDRCMQGVEAVIRGIPLEGAIRDSTLGRTRTYLQTLPDEKNVEFPCVFVTIEGEQEEEGDGDFEDDDVVYPVRVFLADRTDSDYQANRPTYQKWRRQIAREFRLLTTLPEVPECYDIRIVPQVIFDPSLPAYQYMVSGMVIRCFTREVKDRPTS